MAVTTEETIARFEELFGENGRFSKATEVLATTFTGTLSMLSDKLFKFKLETNEAGFFDFVKNALVVINRSIEANQKALSDFATAVGQGMVNFIKQAILGTAALIDTLAPIFRIVFNGINGLVEIIKALPPGMRELGVLGFLMLGRGGKIAVVGILALLKKMGVDLDELANKFFKDNADGNMGRTFEKANEFIKKIDENILASRKSMEELMKAATSFEKETKQVGINLQKIKDNVLESFKKDFESINETIGKMAQSGIKAFSRGLAEALVLGKELNMTFKEIAQKLLVDIVAFTIQIVIQETIRNALKKEQVDDEAKITNELRSQTTELKKQMALRAVGSFFGIPMMAKGGAVSKGQPTIVGERGAELFIPNSSGQIQQSARGTGKGSVNVNFTVNAIDTRGFSEALAENRGTITSIINNALAEKGRGELV
jgi:hypothetical protein